MRAFDGTRELDLGPTKQRAVLAALLLNANKPVSTPQIVDAVWPDTPPENGANVVQKYVAGLRRVLEPDRSPRTPGQILSLTAAGYVLAVPADGLDADVFQDRVRRARSEWTDGRLAPAAAELRGALAMWRAEALAGLSGPVFDAARDRLTEARAGALEALAEIELEQGGHAALVPELATLVAEFPLREQLRYLQMLALYRCGRQPEALAVYRDARAYLADEFGVEPGERLQQLHQRILRSDPTLAPPTDAAPVSPPIGTAPVSPATGAVPPLPTASWPPPSVPPEPPPSTRHALLARVVGTVVPLFSFGSLTWLVFVIYAVHRRSMAYGVAALGYFALIVGFCGVINAFDEDRMPRWADGVAIALLILAMVGGMLHVLTISLMTHRPPPDPAMIEAVEQRARRQQALQVLLHYPAVARELRIGRPDLPRGFDDGGLIDINTVPEEVLTTLPGMTPYLAQRIIADRHIRGGFTSTDDLVARDLLPPAVVQALRDRFVTTKPS